MTSEQFIIWFQGFVEACNDFAPTPKQWDKIKEELEKVNDKQAVSIGVGATGFLNIKSGTDATSLPPGTSITYTTKQQLND
jgi:hypothetical protein